MEHKISPTNEVLSAFLSRFISADDVAQLKNDPKSYIFQSVNMDFGDASLSVVENNEGTVHLALPYYETVGDGKAQVLSDEDAGEIAGGEFTMEIYNINHQALKDLKDKRGYLYPEEQAKLDTGPPEQGK